MCTYNSSRYLGETLHSVFAQTLQDFEIIIVDDGSTDGTPELIERQFPDTRVTVVRQRHVTLRVARPLALAHSSGEFIAFLDSDDLWAPTKLERQVTAARAAPEAGLIFSDCELIDASGRPMERRFSDQFDYPAIDLGGTRGHIELLRRGNFIASPTPFAPAAAIRAVGGFNHSYRHVNDYELWLRLARRYPLKFIDEPLARYRVHDAQFTQRRWEITLPEQCALIRPILRSSSYPRAVRIALGDNLLGQHRLASRGLFKQRRYWLAARAALGMCQYPDRLRDYSRHRLGTTPIGRSVESGIAAYHRGRAAIAWGRDLIARALAHGATFMRRIALRTRRAPRRIVRILRGQEPVVRQASVATETARTAAALSIPIWIDGSSLGGAQAGYFNLLSELIRNLALQQSPTCTVHVSTRASGRAALLARLRTDGSRLRFHRIGWRAAHWSQIHRLLVGWHAQLLLAMVSVLLIALAVWKASSIALSAAAVVIAGQTAVLLDELGAEFAEASGRPRQRYAARLVRFLWRRLPAPRGRAPDPNTVEVLFWRGRFRWRDSRRIAIVQDMTTRILPELHTEGNVVEFDEFLGYVQRHAHTIATVSEHSRQDIIDRIAVCPDSVSVMPMPVHPQYIQPQFSPGFVAWHSIAVPYVLCVATVEPRKNLRRLVRAFELLKEEQAARGLTLVLVGPTGWDSAFREFLVGSDAYSRVRMPGFVPLEHLPSLYHFASAVICPSVYEGFGIPVMEAMCCSAVVLASRISSLPEVLGKDGIQFDPYNTEEMAGALLRALTLSPADAASYRRRCRQRAETHLERLAHQGSLPGFAATPVAETT
jgi:glycosyltransferase involved in cell wall biosynthesis